MVSENQQLSNELVQVQESFERLTEKHSETQRNLSDTEQIVQIKETDIEDLRQAYEVLHRFLSSERSFPGRCE